MPPMRKRDIPSAKPESRDREIIPFTPERSERAPDAAREPRVMTGRYPPGVAESGPEVGTRQLDASPETSPRTVRYRKASGPENAPAVKQTPERPRAVASRGTPAEPRIRGLNGSSAPLVAGEGSLSMIYWIDEDVKCYQMEVDGVRVTRRTDTNFVNGTKLLNVSRTSRGRRDGLLKAEKDRYVVKIGNMTFKGVWIPLERARVIALMEEGLAQQMRPLLEDDAAQYVAVDYTEKPNAALLKPEPVSDIHRLLATPRSERSLSPMAASVNLPAAPRRFPGPSVSKAEADRLGLKSRAEATPQHPHLYMYGYPYPYHQEKGDAPLAPSSLGGPPQGYPPHTYPPQSYPPQSYPPQGYPPQGYPLQAYPPPGYPLHAYPPPGYPQSYPPQAYPPLGYPPLAYPPPGYGYGYPEPHPRSAEAGIGPGASGVPGAHPYPHAYQLPYSNYRGPGQTPDSMRASATTVGATHHQVRPANLAPAADRSPASAAKRRKLELAPRRGSGAINNR